ncbi:MAG: hypothetical protein JO170_05120, partial [Verrucomicrobia bacterium]|nr:hypothetical protein [Verrucomicrobiota bacterium]
MAAEDDSGLFSTKQREDLFIELAKRETGTTAQEVFNESRRLGDTVTIEAYYNLARRLTHRGVLVAEKIDRQTNYKIGQHGEGQWLDEDRIATIVNPDYPLIALTVLQESIRQLNGVPETVWIEIRERLKSVRARRLFVDAIAGYCQNLRDEIENYVLEYGSSVPTPESANLRQKIQGEIFLLRGLVRFGLGLSVEAVQIPLNVDVALRDWEEKGLVDAFYDLAELEREIALRVEDTFIISGVQNVSEDSGLLIAAVDGSTRSGLLARDLEQGDFTVGSYPVVSINTSVGYVNRMIKAGGTSSPAFARLPEKPEDMQQSENRHTIMAKLFYPDITDGEYVHSVWNAMDVLEARMTLRVMRRWYTSRASVEIRPADLVLRDGTVS